MCLQPAGQLYGARRFIDDTTDRKIIGREYRRTGADKCSIEPNVCGTGCRIGTLDRSVVMLDANECASDLAVCIIDDE